jgi:subtilase family serine protease
MRRTNPKRFYPELFQLEALILPTFVVPWQLNQAYSLTNLTFTSGNQTVKADGSGQTIAIVDAFHDPNLAWELAVYDTVFQLPAANLTQVNLAGKATDDGWAGEEVMDAELVHSIAPGAKIVVVEAASDSINDLLTAINTARNLPGVSVVSMSWGGSEWYGQTSLDGYFTTPAGHQGETFVAATGDNSAWSGASWPASSANVVAVGGTSLYINPVNGTYSMETAWSGSGGGLSQVVPEPYWQTSVQSTGARTTPDVSMDADPNTGFLIFGVTPSTGQYSWQQVAGTSASTQTMAALIAIADQGRTLAGKSSLDGASQTLPAIYSLPSSDFHDITFGSNGYRATPGYDLVTGRGSPVGSSFVRDLVNYGGATAVVSSTTKAVTSGTVKASASVLVTVAVSSPTTAVSTASIFVPIAPASNVSITSTSTSTGSASATSVSGSTSSASVARSLPPVKVSISGLGQSLDLSEDEPGRTEESDDLDLDKLFDAGYPLWFLP